MNEIELLQEILRNTHNINLLVSIFFYTTLGAGLISIASEVIKYIRARKEKKHGRSNKS